MGQLHEGHISLLDQARKDCDQLVCSVFVNPFQFNDQRDFSNYPRDLASDQRKAKSAGCDLFFCPSVEDIYPRQPLIHIDFGPITREMEGKYRPGHFNGVAIVLSKLFHMVGPRIAYFGEKDWQQCLLAERLSEDLSFGLEIKILPTRREESGLAISSRNSRLTSLQRKQAAHIYTHLQEVADGLKSGLNLHKLQEETKERLHQLAFLELEYFEIVDSYTMSRVKDVNQHKSISLCIAAHIGGVRLIDHLRITQE